MSVYRVNYVNFLSEFGPRTEVWHKGNDMFSLLAHPRTPLGMADIIEPPQNGLIGVSAKLRNKVRRCSERKFKSYAHVFHSACFTIVPKHSLRQT